MIKRELAKNPELANESWDRFLPNFKKRNLSKRHKPHVVHEKHNYTPFPPVPEKSKVDLQIESGEYFLNKESKERAKKEERKEKQLERKEERKREREKDFEPPMEAGDEEKRKKKKRKRDDKKE